MEETTSAEEMPLEAAAPLPPTNPAVDASTMLHAETDLAGAPRTDAALEHASINKVEVLSNRLVPGSDGSIEHVVIANNAVTVIRSTPLKGRVRITKDNVYVGGVSCKILLTGLAARVDTVRHLVGGESLVYGGLFLSKQRNTPVKKFGSVTIGSPQAVIQALIDAHCAVDPSLHLKALAAELDGMFLPYELLSGNAVVA